MARLVRLNREDLRTLRGALSLGELEINADPNNDAKERHDLRRIYRLLKLIDAAEDTLDLK